LMLFFQIGERRKNENSNYENKRISDEKLLQARLWWTSFESYKQFSFFNNNGYKKKFLWTISKKFFHKLKMLFEAKKKQKRVNEFSITFL
jgi:hypothetical protein